MGRSLSSDSNSMFTDGMTIAVATRILSYFNFGFVGTSANFGFVVTSAFFHDFVVSLRSLSAV